MTKTPWIVGAAMAISLAATGYAHAKPGGDAPRTRADMQAKIADHFKKVDTNADGAITRPELEAAQAAMKAKWAEKRAERQDERFTQLDTNKDGQLSRAEFTAPRQRDGEAKDGRGHGGKHMAHHGHRGHRGGMMMGGHWFDRADANKDGRVTLAEAQAGPLAMFDKMDTNKDGTISAEEHQAMRAKWKDMRGKADKN